MKPKQKRPLVRPNRVVKSQSIPRTQQIVSSEWTLLVIALLLGVVVFGVIYFSYNKNEQISDPRPPITPNIPYEPAPPEIEDGKKESIEDALTLIDHSELQSIVEKLASDEFEGRMSGKKGNEKTADLVEDYFKKINLKTARQEFKIQRVNNGPHNEVGKDTTENVYGWIEGKSKKDEIIVVGAHMDHIGYGPTYSRGGARNKIHPGADDNASGTACLMVIAKALSSISHQLDRTIIFQAYSAEEMGLIGSQYYCSNPILPESSPNLKNHIFMLNMDMVGYLGKGVHQVGFSSGDSSVDVKEIIKNLNGRYSFAQQITGLRSGGSDHASFYNKGVPIAFLHTGGHAYYHTPEDTADKLNYGGMEDIAKYATEFVWQVSNGVKPTFNYATYQWMPPIHDHGISEFGVESESTHSHNGQTHTH